MNIKQKEIVLLPYPFSNLEETKVRPAVVISNNFFNDNSNDFVAIPITSIAKEDPYSVMLGQNDLDFGKLLKESRIRVDKIFTVEKNLIIMKIGAINNKTFENIKSKIKEILSL
ncbi:type II toxin-antitoxin system PemK/MazF family toxin [Candidatus Woesearchaeota archaeon]|nr:type II toxin-antitoxin system PemK/MazF family toxin [Candidatus Woesearchaeota archaeon]